MGDRVHARVKPLMPGAAVVMVAIQGFAPTTNINGKIVTLVPLKNPGGAPAAMASTDVGGTTVFGWRCGNNTDGTNLNPKFLPGSCRG